MPDDGNEGKYVFDFDTHEEYEEFRRREERLYGDTPFDQVGKHTNNVIVFVPGRPRDIQQVISGDLDPFDPQYQEEREREVLEYVREAVGSPPEGVTISAGSHSYGKGAEGLPQQFIELMGSFSDVSGGLAALYLVGKYAIKLMKRMHADQGEEVFLLNKGGVVAVCAVDLQDNRGIEEYTLVSVVEAQEGQRWDPSLDGRDVYYVTFQDYKGGYPYYRHHLYVANARGAILHYSDLSLARTWAVRPSFLEDD
jgi:hypothetical protein